MSDRNERGEFLPGEGSKRRSISTRLTDEEYQRFKDECAAAGEPPTVLLRQLILDWLEGQERSKSLQNAA